jgi:hypothetical protein
VGSITTLVPLEEFRVVVVTVLSEEGVDEFGTDD